MQFDRNYALLVVVTSCISKLAIPFLHDRLVYVGTELGGSIIEELYGAHSGGIWEKEQVT